MIPASVREGGFLRNALLAVSPSLYLSINDLGHVARDINIISVVIKKGAHQQYYITLFQLCLSSFSSSLSPSPS